MCNLEQIKDERKKHKLHPGWDKRRCLSKLLEQQKRMLESSSVAHDAHWWCVIAEVSSSQERVQTNARTKTIMTFQKVWHQGTG